MADIAFYMDKVTVVLIALCIVTFLNTCVLAALLYNLFANIERRRNEPEYTGTYESLTRPYDYRGRPGA